MNTKLSESDEVMLRCMIAENLKASGTPCTVVGMTAALHAVKWQIHALVNQREDTLRIFSKREDRFKEEALIIARKAQELNERVEVWQSHASELAKEFPGVDWSYVDDFVPHVRDLRAQLATSQARLADMEKGAPSVLGHPATPEWCKAVDEHHAATESALAQAKQEGATLRERIQAVADAAGVESKQLLRANTQLQEQVEAHKDLQHAINAALNKTDARGVSEVEQIEWLSAQLQAGEADKRKIRSDAFVDAAQEIESHWNARQQSCNQFEQAQRSGKVLRGLARAALPQPSDKPLSAPADSKP